MSRSASSASKGTLKLVIDTKASKVLYAEADKVFVDFVLSILVLPVGALLRLTKENDSVWGSLGVLYNSVQNLDHAYMNAFTTKSLLLQTDVAVTCNRLTKFTLRFDGARASINKMYKCSSDYDSADTVFGDGDDCDSDPDTSGFKGPSIEGDFVKAPITCMVMEDLCVQPLSTAHILDAMGSLKDVNKVKEITASKLLKAALRSRNVLTDVFLKGSCHW
uniref:DUF674 family protein n=1 Tax=Kalanchoe fedtschenkoi TaxID=63787 RepID=A0A7N0UDE4_KALFE